MSKESFKEEDFGLIKAEQHTVLLPYVLEMRNPEVQIHLVHFSDISLIVLPLHRIAFWDERRELENLFEHLSEKWDSLKYDQDKIITLFSASRVEYYPGKEARKGTLACSINHIQAFKKVRKFSSQKEFSPSDLKKNLGQYDTPFWLAKFSIHHLSNIDLFIQEDVSLVDPMAGEGSFLEASFHYWIVNTLKQSLSLHDHKDVTCTEAQKILKNKFQKEKFVGIERDKIRSYQLNTHFNSILKIHGLPKYEVSINKDLFNVNRSDIKANNIIFIGNPCWDVIETTKTVRSRTKSARVVESKRSAKDKSLQEKTIEKFESKFDLKCSLKDYRNVYALTIAKCLSLGDGEAPMSMILPKGILGDKTTQQLREVIGEYRPQLFIDEFKNKASGSRIFPAVDARVQFCVITVIPRDSISRYFKTRRHGVEFSPQRSYVNVSWGWGEKRFLGTNQWIVFKDKVDKAVADKVTNYPALEIHSEIEFEAGRSRVSDYFLEGKDIECFKIRKSGSSKNLNKRILVRKILPNGGRKLIAATDCGKANLKDSLISIKVEQSEEQLYYILGILNSAIGEYRLRLTQSNINLNLWKLKQLHLPVFNPQEPLHREISKLAKNLSKRWSKEQNDQLDKLVPYLFGLTEIEVGYIFQENNIPQRAA